MSVEEAKKEVAAINRAADRHGKSAESVRAFLIKHKILKPDGKLADRFKV